MHHAITLGERVKINYSPPLIISHSGTEEVKGFWVDLRPNEKVRNIH